ncbi:peptidase inhibitor family I36 protein [Streptomyces sp. NPDC057682]|uniref:peptidase inhibitor family I36 protein n=1 Tax=unclassified Streptomyces TaxID=2593676 RepID=UPI00364FB55D
MFKNNLARRAATLTLAAAALTGAGVFTASNAFAVYAPKDGYLDAEEFGLYYSPNQQGCVFDLYSYDSDFSDDYFKPFVGSCNGQGQSVNDNTASYYNRDTLTWWVYTDANAGGGEGSLPPGHIGNASTAFRNKISSAFHYHPQR